MSFVMSKQNVRDVESKKGLLESESDEDQLYSRNTGRVNGNGSDKRMGPKAEFFHFLTSVGLCFSIIYTVFGSFCILIAAALLDNVLSIILMALCVIYMNECPLEVKISPALFAYGFTSLVKSLVSFWTDLGNFREPAQSTSMAAAAAPSANLYGKHLRLILYNGLQLLSFGFFIYSCWLVFPLYSTLEAEDMESKLGCNKILYWYSFSYLCLNIAFVILFIVWIPCVLICVLSSDAR